MAYIKSAWNGKSDTCSYFVYGRDWQGGVFTIIKKVHFLVFSAVGVVSPSSFFWGVGAWGVTYVKNHEMIRVLYVVICPNYSKLLCDRNQQGEIMYKCMKNDHFLVFLAACVLFPRFLGRLRSGLC